MRNRSLSQYAEGVDYSSFDMSGYEDIVDKLEFNMDTRLNFVNISEKSQNSIQSIKLLPLDNDEKNISFKRILQELGIKSYVIIEDNKKRNIEDLKIEGVCYIGRINDSGEFDIESIDGNFNNFKYGSLSKNSSCSKNNKPYVLFYNKENPTKILDKVRLFFSKKYHKLLISF